MSFKIALVLYLFIGFLINSIIFYIDGNFNKNMDLLVSIFIIFCWPIYFIISLISVWLEWLTHIGKNK